MLGTLVVYASVTPMAERLPTNLRSSRQEY